jgi:hypothetical protein
MVFLRTLLLELVYHSSWRFRILLLVGLALIVAALALLSRDGRQSRMRPGPAPWNVAETERQEWVPRQDRATMPGPPMQWTAKSGPRRGA